jgi:hypothetical protein
MPEAAAGSAHPSSASFGAELPPRLNRPGGDVEVAVERDGATLRLRGTWRRAGLRALWSGPLLAIEVAVLGGLWWQGPSLRPVVLVAAALALGRHLLRAGREVRGIAVGWLELDEVGVRGPAIGASLRWEAIREVRVSGDLARPRIGYVPATGSTAAEPGPVSAGPVPIRRSWWRAGGPRTPAAGPDVLPTELLLDLLIPVDAVVALGDAGTDPIDVRVADEGFHVRPRRGRPVSMRWDALAAVEVTAVPAGRGRLARSVDLLGEVRLPGAARTREELVSLPITLARSSGLVDALGRVDAALPGRLEEPPAGTHALWNR